MGYKRKTWEEKLEDKANLPKELKLRPNFPCAKALMKLGAKSGDTVVITQPKEVLEIMRRVPKGKLVTINEICERLAKRHGAKFCCTLTAGIFVMIAANAAEETKDGTPYWRTLKMDGALNEKFPGGQEAQRKRLENEGHKIVKTRKRLYVEDFQKCLWRNERDRHELLR